MSWTGQILLKTLKILLVNRKLTIMDLNLSAKKVLAQNGLLCRPSLEDGNMYLIHSIISLTK